MALHAVIPGSGEEPGGKHTKRAVKMLRGGASEADRKDFMNEAQAMFDLMHPQLVAIIGVVMQQVLCPLAPRVMLEVVVVAVVVVVLVVVIVLVVVAVVVAVVVVVVVIYVVIIVVIVAVAVVAVVVVVVAIFSNMFFLCSCTRPFGETLTPTITLP